MDGQNERPLSERTQEFTRLPGTSVYHEMAEKNIYEVQQILGKRDIKGYVEYFVRWKGFSSDWDTWEPAENLSNCKNLITEYDKKHKNQAVKLERNEMRRCALKLVKKSRQSKSLTKLDKETKCKLIRNGPMQISKRTEKKKSVMKQDKASNLGSGKKDIHGRHLTKKEKTVNRFIHSKLFSSKISFSNETLTTKDVPIILKKKFGKGSVKHINASNANKDKKPKTLSTKSLAQKALDLQAVIDQVARGNHELLDDSSRIVCKHKRGLGDDSKSSLPSKKQTENKTKDKEILKKGVKRKQDKVDGSDDDDDDVLYSVNDIASCKHKTEELKLSNKTDDSLDSSVPIKKASKNLVSKFSNVNPKFTNDLVKGKTVKRLSGDTAVNQNHKKPKKQLILLGEMKAKDSSSSVLHPVTPVSLYTSVKPVSPVRGQPPAGQPLPGPSMMNAYFGDFGSYKMRAPVMPMSPTSISYKALLDNLPRQLHLKNSKNKKQVEREQEVVERRVSVRAMECAFRYKEIVVKKCQGYTQIWLNTRTNQKNAINPQVVQEIISALNSAKYDDSKLVMFSSIGNVFCSGVDLNFFKSADRKVTARQMADAVRNLTQTFIKFPKPIVATVTGAAIGLGLALLPLCDVVYASDKALFHLPYTQLSQTPEGCVSYTLPLAVGPAMSSELLFAGRKLTALEAQQLGLVSQVFWPTSLMQEVIPRVQYMAMHSAKAMEATKLLVRSHQRTKLELTNEIESNLLLERWSNGECQQAIEVYLSDDKNILI
ncbi:chromodomain Y-like protein 2 [Gigantopelta aegis]|uniref:chromodomain Y-like protein 2 n=1 Tax=Gigantopelta aegis TaxID=1735272 RepID=UPI001B88D677|nr:chromodomain Y-like protein 2 [Gigantopelta aegis]